MSAAERPQLLSGLFARLRTLRNYVRFLLPINILQRNLRFLHRHSLQKVKKRGGFKIMHADSWLSSVRVEPQPSPSSKILNGVNSTQTGPKFSGFSNLKGLISMSQQDDGQKIVKGFKVAKTFKVFSPTPTWHRRPRYRSWASAELLSRSLEPRRSSSEALSGIAASGSSSMEDRRREGTRTSSQPCWDPSARPLFSTRNILIKKADRWFQSW